jgi:hypothetical protein
VCAGLSAKGAISQFISQRAARDGVYMFGCQVMFIHCGDSPTLVQCSRCHMLGHYVTSERCKAPPNSIKCFRCGGLMMDANMIMNAHESTRPWANVIASLSAYSVAALTIIVDRRNARGADQAPVASQSSPLTLGLTSPRLMDRDPQPTQHAKGSRARLRLGKPHPEFLSPTATRS